jgi:tRNA(Ile)-lysidine synthase
MAGDGASATPLGPAEFAALMAPFEPFEPAPRLAVAVSGGADSVALALLGASWAKARGGAMTALTVDHRLRPEAAAEAAQVGHWLAARGIAHLCLVRAEPRPERDLQAQARAARYRLLEAWCAETEVLHLLVAHHREDQAETLLLRLARGSGLDGLAGMAAVTERAACRIVRPLLGLSHRRLVATLDAAGQSWIEDPSNRDPAYARARLRQGRAALAAAGLGEARLAETAQRLARSRAAVEAAVAALLARAAVVHPLGFVRLDAAALSEAPEEVGLRALAAVLALVAGAEYPPRLARLERLYRHVAAGFRSGRTLGGCRLLPRRDGVLVCREPAAVAPPVAAVPGRTTVWDGRFRLTLPRSAPAGLTLGALGPAPLGAAAAGLPAVVRATLPALRDDAAVVAVPSLRYVRDGYEGDGFPVGSMVLRPTRPLTGAGFTVV